MSGQLVAHFFVETCAARHRKSVSRFRDRRVAVRWERAPPRSCRRAGGTSRGAVGRSGSGGRGACGRGGRCNPGAAAWAGAETRLPGAGRRGRICHLPNPAGLVVAVVPGHGRGWLGASGPRLRGDDRVFDLCAARLGAGPRVRLGVSGYRRRVHPGAYPALRAFVAETLHRSVSGTPLTPAAALRSPAPESRLHPRRCSGSASRRGCG